MLIRHDVVVLADAISHILAIVDVEKPIAVVSFVDLPLQLLYLISHDVRRLLDLQRLKSLDRDDPLA